jgi:hypothetical protein
MKCNAIGNIMGEHMENLGNKLGTQWEPDGNVLGKLMW